MLNDKEKMVFRFSKSGYGQGFHEGKIQERKYWKDKIKAKIKELEKLNEESIGIGYWFAIYYLQLLLEKE